MAKAQPSLAKKTSGSKKSAGVILANATRNGSMIKTNSSLKKSLTKKDCK